MDINKPHPNRAFLLALAVAIAIAGASSAGILAQVQPAPERSGQALEISPTLTTIEVDPGETTTLELRLRNVSREALLVTGDVNDFVAADETGVPKVLMDEEAETAIGNNPYSMKDWLEPLPPLLLEPQEIETLTATINVPVNASPGGHYGIVRFSGTPPELEGTGVSLAASVGTLMLVTVSGDVVEGVEIEEFIVTNDGVAGTLFESTPLQLVQRIRNTGNVHVRPAGRAIIKDMFGRNVAAANVNLAQHNILPESIRRFEQDVDSSLIGNKRLFGRYTADLELNYGEDKVLTGAVTFWVIPYRLIGAVILVFLIGILIVRHLLKRYKRRILAQAKG